MGALAALLVAVAAAAFVCGSARLGRRWWAFLLAGAAAWLVAQPVKGLISVAVVLLASPGQPLPAAVARFAGAAAFGWYPVYAAALPAVVEEAARYLPLRWLRVAERREALALGIGAGVAEALLLAATSLAAHLTPGAWLQLAAVWERVWSIILHGGLATLVGLAATAPGRRRLRWLLAAVGLHFLADLPAGFYQHEAALGSPHLVVWLTAAEVLAAALALAALWIGKAGWARLHDRDQEKS